MAVWMPVWMPFRVRDEPPKDVVSATIESLNLDGEFSGELAVHEGSTMEDLRCFGQFIPPIRCAGCDVPLMLSTFYDGQHECYGHKVERRGRVVLCGSFDHHKIRRCELDHVPPPNGVHDMFRVSRDYYCSEDCPSGRLTGYPKKTVLEVDCENPFIRTVFNGPDMAELMQDRVQRLNCPKDCKGQCLLDACVRNADDAFNSKEHCPDCKRPFWVSQVEPFEEFMEKVGKGVVGDQTGVVMCKNIVETPNECPRCDEYLGIYRNQYLGKPVKDAEGCIGIGCDGRCLDQYVKNYIVPSSLKRSKK